MCSRVKFCTVTLLALLLNTHVVAQEPAQREGLYWKLLRDAQEFADPAELHDRVAPYMAEAEFDYVVEEAVSKVAVTKPAGSLEITYRVGELKVSETAFSKEDIATLLDGAMLIAKERKVSGPDGRQAAMSIYYQQVCRAGGVREKPELKFVSLKASLYATLFGRWGLVEATGNPGGSSITVGPYGATTLPFRAFIPEGRTAVLVNCKQHLPHQTVETVFANRLNKWNYTLKPVAKRP